VALEAENALASLRLIHVLVGFTPAGREIQFAVWASSRRQTFPPVTLANMRSHGCRKPARLLHFALVQSGATLNGDWLPDETVPLDLDRRMVCTACGLIGADVRPDWTPMTGSAGMGGAHRRAGGTPGEVYPPPGAPRRTRRIVLPPPPAR
jgi:hypothetical protein